MEHENTTKPYRAKKSLGQNFLKSVPALIKIIEAGEVSTQDTVLEIGPGKGALTERLLEKAGQVIAIEKDYELFAFLSEKFATEIEEKKLILLREDVLEFDIHKMEGYYKVIANIPYNITGAILKKFLTAPHQPERMVLMVQHEVAKRIIGREGKEQKESILSISVKAYGTPRLVMKVPARYFSPAPKVDSAVIAITGISRQIFDENMLDEEKFWEIVKAGFAHKRKLLSGNLKEVVFAEKLDALGLSKKRAEDVALSDWIKLAQ